MKGNKKVELLDKSLVNPDEKHGHRIESNVVDPTRREILKGAAGGALTIGTLAMLNENAHAASSKPIPIRFDVSPERCSINGWSGI